MVDEQHIVEKVKVDIDVDSIELAERVKSEINDFIQEEVLSIIEAYFADLNLPPELKEKTIQLDKLDLSVDASSWNPQSSQLKQEIRTEVEKQMNPIVEKLKEESLKRNSSVSKGYDAIREESTQVYSKEERVLKSMFYFLDHGTLPWWVKSIEESRELFSESSLISTLREQSVLAEKELRKRRNNQSFRQRLAQQFPVAVVSEMIQIQLSLTLDERERVTRSIGREIKTLPKSISSRLINLIVELSSPDLIDKAFQQNSGSTLFKFIHVQYFDTALNHKQLESTLSTTNALLRVLHYLASKESRLEEMKLDFQKSLNNHLSSEVLTPLRKTKAYQEMFSGVDSIQEDNEVENSANQKLISGLEEVVSSSTDSVNEDDDAQIDPVSQIQNDNLERDNQETIATPEETLSSQLEELSSNETNEPSSQEKASVSESETNDSVKPDSNIKAEEQTIDKINTEESEQRNENINETKASDQTAQSKEKESQSEIHEDESAQVNAENQHKDSVIEKELHQKEEERQDGTERSESESISKREDSESGGKQPAKSESESNVKKDFTKTDETTTSETEEMIEKEEKDELSEILKKRTDDLASTRKKSMDEMPNQLFVENAGLVLLNPFILPLFKHLELLDEDGKLIDPDLAACILHYAATGREGDFEFEMAFEKYLCGIPPTVSLDREIKLTEEQKQEVGKVLNSVLEHWSALNSKSTALLRNEFLTRSGKLIVEKSNHRLIVEKKAFDLLLDKLPWSYSLIKFSWKKELMFVEW